MFDVDATNAMADVADARMSLTQMVKSIIDNGLSADDHKMILEWIPKIRKVMDEIDMLCKTKTPSVEDTIAEIMELGEWNPHKWYVVTRVMRPQYADLGPELPFTMDGRGVKEAVESDLWGVLYAHVYLVNDDGTLSFKR